MNFCPMNSSTNEYHGEKFYYPAYSDPLFDQLFQQPDINPSKYVAFGCEITLDDGSTDDSKPNRFSRMLEPQIGCLVRHTGGNDCLVYSAQTGLARLPADSVQPWMYLGGWMKYEIARDPSSLSSSQANRSTTTWIARDPLDLGMLFDVEEDQLDGGRLQITLNCIVNRVSITNRHAWLWSDFIGRIYVPPGCFRHSLIPMECVKAKVVYTGAFDDVPWSALHLEVIGPSDEIRQANAQLLLTDDNWTITHVQSQQGTFFGFMENHKYGSAFIAWTDLIEGEMVPTKEQRCRATVFKQHREKKHQWRAVLVAPLEDKAASYPLYIHSGVPQIPCPIRPPLQPPPAASPSPVPRPIGTRTGREKTNVTALRTSPPPGIMGLPIELSVLVQPQSAATSATTSVPRTGIPPARRLWSLQQMYPGSSASLPTSSAPTPSVTSPSQNFSSDDGSDTFSENPEIDLLGAQFGDGTFRLTDEFSHWLPPASSSSSSFLPIAFRPPGSASPSTTCKVDVGTQTDMISEQRVLRDIVQNHELLMKVFEAFPTHMDMILNMKWQSTASSI